jgi:uncharacterized membrane protein YbhN (UPF0104 family)
MAHYWAESSGAIWHPIVAWAIGCSLALGAAGYFFSAASWAQICRALGLEISGITACRIYFISQFGKYLPGNIAQHAGRLAMSVREKLSGTAVATSQLVEILLVVGSLTVIAATVGSSYLTQWQPEVIQIRPWQILLATTVLVFVGLLALRLVRNWNRMRHFSDLIHRLIASRQGITHLGSATLLIIANAATTTLSLYFIATAVSGSHTLPIMDISFIFIVSWLAGFVTPGAPAGLGVRETVMLALLSQMMATPDAVATSLGFRIATTGTDLAIFFLGLCLPSPRRSVTTT